MRVNKKYSFIGLSTFVISLAVFGFVGGGKASAATLTVSSGCTLPEAIGAINAAQDENGCVNTDTDSYGTGDTINLPAGTITTSADLPTISKAVKIVGAGKGSTTVNADGHIGFKADYSGNFQEEISFSNLTISNADPLAIDILYPLSTKISNVEVKNSHRAIRIESAKVVVDGVSIHDNIDTTLGQGLTTGLGIILRTKSDAVVQQATVKNAKLYNNQGDITGITVSVDDQSQESGNPVLTQEPLVKIQDSSVLDSKAEGDAGIMLVQSGGPLTRISAELQVSAVTVANNQVIVTQPQANSPFGTLPIFVGMLVTGKLSGNQTVTNVTIANNTINNPAPDNRQTLAGFVGSLSGQSVNMAIRSTTVVGNSVSQPSSAQAKMPAFFAAKVVLNQSFQVVGAQNGSTAVNSLIANNTFNGQSSSCLSGFNTDFFGLTGMLDVTPLNGGYNMTDDQGCSGYSYVANLWDTIDHQIADNGGPVPTVKLLPGSPAINGGGNVLGVTTDARGVARSGYFSVGAYQGELLAATTTNASGTLAKTGVATVSAVIVGLILLVVLIYTYIDYLRHRKPLVQADPFARQTYTYRHHIRTVTIPLMKYRVHISFNRNPSGITKF